MKITDTGIGISEEFLPGMFKNFAQEEQGYTRRYDGSGLGLSLVSEYATLNNISVDVKSKKGAGSTFSLVFGINKISN
ncbi:MAG: hypothetical protein K9J12_18580 [Melioribacteraceae bacterium]|nr:hypothetical protein [Melioribacteraceae bacterium]MCF8265900.1 hypothetical protein [Melioribacteraceae bacterium]MCF8413503.1 hypothetical protein [Melioribacteraceae bacterium]MCF8431712.1 hypothetical protein [Melioribacteraceae bacterium]